MQRLLLFPLVCVLLLVGCSADDSWLTDSPLENQKPDSIAINPRSRYVVVVGDVQTYTMTPDFMKYFKASMDWIEVQQEYFGNIDAIIQVGDVTNDNEEWQWRNAVLAMQSVAGKIPTIVVTGNHDYTWLKDEGDRFSIIPERSSTLINEYTLPQARGLTVVERYEAGSIENVIYSLEIGGRRCHVIALEFGTRREVAEWASRHARSYPGVDCYLVTHEWIAPDGSMVVASDSYAARQFSETSEDVLSASEVWERVVKPNDNVIAVVCGHNKFALYREDMNDAGRAVPQILFNLQYQDNGGDSMLQLWEFPEESDSVYTYIYHTMKRIHHPDVDKRFTFSRRRAGQ